MVGFNWTASRLARLRSAVRAANAALTRRAKELVAAGLSDLVPHLPERFSVQEVMGRVNNVNDFRHIVGYRNDARRGRTSELTRVLKSVRPDALEFTTQNGTVTTNYAKREYENDVRAIRRRREQSMRDMRRPLFDGDESFDTSAMEPEEVGTLTTNNDLMPDGEGEPDETATDVDADTLNRWRQEDARAKRSSVSVDSMYFVYVRTWENPLNRHMDMPGYQNMLDALTWLLEHRPDVLNKMFNLGRDELDPWYITESGGASNPYANIPYETRHSRAVNYVVDMAVHAGMYGNALDTRLRYEGPTYL